MTEHPPPPRGGGLSLYANLLDDPSSATISAAPVRYDRPGDDSETAKNSLADAALRFQPIRRPQAKQKPKSALKGFPPTRPVTTVPGSVPAGAKAATDGAPQPPVRSTLADWAPTEEDEFMYASANRQRPKKKKRKGGDDAARRDTDWNDIYDPARPTSVEEYLRSDERIDELRDWRSMLYRHRRRDDGSRSGDDNDEEEERCMQKKPQFVPSSASHEPLPSPQSPSAAPVIYDDATGGDAYARRQAMSQGGLPPLQPPPSSPPAAPSAPVDTSVPPPPPAPIPIPEEYSAVITRAPVLYVRPERPASDDKEDDDEGDNASLSPPRPGPGLGADPSSTDDADAPRSVRPGQAGFAHRLMSKYGWKKGLALGADGSGLLDPLRAKVEKRRKRPDSEGGGWAEPGGRGKIIGGRRKVAADPGSFGPMSQIVVLRKMLDGMEDLADEIEDGLGQEIGEECGEKYGRVERLYIDQVNRQVFIKFIEQISALRAVEELDGRDFNGNTIEAKFYDMGKFQRKEYV